jgi:ABC-type molybdate transport system substrate-binding protein
MKRIRKAIAIAIISTAIGFCVESENPYGRIRRAPFTGAVIVFTAATIKWAINELEKQ